MLIIPPPLFRPHRGRVKNAAVAQPDVLMVQRLENFAPESNFFDMTAVFNTTEANPLQSVGTASPGKWTARYQGKRYTGTFLTLIRFDQLFMGFNFNGTLEDGPDELNYSNNPSDISDESGRILRAFNQLPIE